MSKSSRSFWAFVVGAAAGAVIGILYAPDKGENTRSKLYFQLNKYRDQLKQLINDIVDGKEVIETTAKSEGKKVVQDAKIKAEKLLEDVEKMMTQIKAKYDAFHSPFILLPWDIILHEPAKRGEQCNRKCHPGSFKTERRKATHLKSR